MPERGQFIRPAPWGIGAGPDVLRSIAEAERATTDWLEMTPEHIAHHQERERLLALRQILRNSGPVPSEAGLQSAKVAIKGFVEFAHLKERPPSAGFPTLRRS